MRSMSLSIVLAGVLPFVSPLALAQHVAQPAYEKEDISSFHGTADSLPSAIGKIEGATGGKVIEIRFTSSNGMPGYHVVVAKGGEVQFMHLEARSGKLTTTHENMVPVAMLKWRGKADVHFAETAKVPLSVAIHTAEQADDNAPAIAAGIARSASSPSSDVHAYNILIVRDGTVRRRAVDSDTGEVIADPSALADWP
ncbi:MAG: hypothetical protein JWM91_1755 [Rhodospirillales bacterium]|nr:hypothetical protein [Rhodospirillales bacterium]